MYVCKTDTKKDTRGISYILRFWKTSALLKTKFAYVFLAS